MNRRIQAVVAAAVGLLAGCNTMLEVEKQSSKVKNDGEEVPEGIVYFLPARAFSITLAFEFQACGSDKGSLVLPYTPAATVTDVLVPDRSEAFLLQYSSLNAKTKITDITVTLWDNGVLKSINAEVEDRSAQVVTSTLEAAGSLARAAGVLTFFTATDDDGLCDADFRKRIAAVGQAQTNLDNEAKVDKQRAQFRTLIQAYAAKTEELKARLATVPKDSDEWKAVQAEMAKVDVARKGVEAELKKLGDPKGDELRQELLKAKAAVTLKVNRTWMPRPGSFSLDVQLPDAELARLLTDKGRQQLSTQPALRPAGQFTVIALGGSATKTSDTAKNPSRGIVFRQPIQGELFVCNGSCKASEQGMSGEIVARQVYSMPQFGVSGSLPLSNGAFDKNTLVLTQLQDGTVTSLKFTSAASAERAAAAAKESSAKFLETAKGLLSDRREQQKAEREERTAERKEQSEIRDAEQDVLKDRTENIRLLKALEKERAGFADRQQLQIDRNTKEVELIQTEINLIKKRKERDAELLK